MLRPQARHLLPGAMIPASLSPRTFVCLLPAYLCAGCWTGAYSRESADAQVYPLLETVSARVTGQKKAVAVERPASTLRQRLIESPTPVTLTLVQSLDVAAENSREFQRQKEQLYLAALDLTRDQHDFEVLWGPTPSSGGPVAASLTATATLAS